jgi:hypothetical protein
MPTPPPAGREIAGRMCPQFRRRARYGAAIADPRIDDAGIRVRRRLIGRYRGSVFVRRRAGLEGRASPPAPPATARRLTGRGFA